MPRDPGHTQWPAATARYLLDLTLAQYRREHWMDLPAAVCVPLLRDSGSAELEHVSTSGYRVALEWRPNPTNCWPDASASAAYRAVVVDQMLAKMKEAPPKRG